MLILKENELLCSKPIVDWKQMCKNIHETTNSNYWKEYSLKVLIWYFKTPQIQRKYKENITWRCWRQCGEQIANQSWKVISGFWEKSIRELSKIFGISFNKNSLVLLLGKVPEVINKEDHHLFLIIRAALIKQITRKWLKDNVTNDKWKDLVKEIHEMEKITTRDRNQVYISEERWEKWLRYITVDVKNDFSSHNNWSYEVLRYLLTLQHTQMCG